MKKTFSLIALCLVLLISSLPNVGARQKTSFEAPLFAAGQKTSPDVPLIVTISGNPNAPAGYRIVGDGRDYVDGQEGVYARFQVGNGSNDFIFDPTNTSARVPRSLWFDFTGKIADGTIPNPWSPGLTKIDTYVNFDQVYTVAVGAGVNGVPPEERVGGFGQLFAGGKKTNYRVAFRPDPTAIYYTAINTPNFTAHLVVSHPDCNTWTITPETVSYADFGYGSGSGPVAGLIGVSNIASPAGQYLMPFQITLKRATPLTCQ